MIKLDDIGSNRLVGVVVAYVVISFAVLEGLDVLVDALGLPASILTVAAVLAIVGLPVAAGAAWYAQRRAVGATESAAGDASEARIREEAGGGRRSRAWLAAGIGAIAALGALGAGWWYSGTSRTAAAPLDHGMVAVMPFGTGGAHAELAWLEQGVMDLLAAKLSGEFGPRALDPRTVLSRLGTATGTPSEERARTTARNLAAGLVLTGSVVGSADRFTINAKLYDVATGDERSRASVATDADGLASAVDELVIALLSLDAGEAEHRLATLTSTDPAAVRSYLSGQAYYRQGRYPDAVAAFDHALDVDSTFALAGIGLSDAAAMTLEPELLRRGPRGMRLALAAAGNLGPIDRRFLELRSGAHAPATYEGRRRFREQAVREMPDRAELWYLLGDLYFHWGNLIDIPDPLERAERAFNKAVELDSLHYVSIQHLGWTAAARGDTAALRHYVELQKKRIDGEPNAILRLDEALATGDTAEYRRFEAAIDTAGTAHLRSAILVVHSLFWPGISAEAAERAARRLPQIAETNTGRIDGLWLLHDFSLNAGRPGEAAKALDRLERLGADRRLLLQQRVRDALYWDGDQGAGEAAAIALEQTLTREDVDSAEAVTRCAIMQWHAHQGTERPRDRDRLAELAASSAAERGRLRAELCLALVDALLASRTDPPAAFEAIATLDSILAQGPITDLRDAANVALARILGERGGYVRAAEVADRIGMDPSLEDYWSSLRYETGRWAERAGDFAAARLAYANYLRLRHDPEPALEAQVEDVRRRLEALSGEIGG